MVPATAATTPAASFDRHRCSHLPTYLPANLPTNLHDRHAPLAHVNKQRNSLPLSRPPCRSCHPILSLSSFSPPPCLPALSFSPSPFARSLYLIVTRAVPLSPLAVYAYTDRRTRDRIDVSSANCISIPVCRVKLHLRLLRYARPRPTLGHTPSPLFSASPTTLLSLVSLSFARSREPACARSRPIGFQQISLDRKSPTDRILSLSLSLFGTLRRSVAPPAVVSFLYSRRVQPVAITDRIASRCAVHVRSIHDDKRSSVYRPRNHGEREACNLPLSRE